MSNESANDSPCGFLVSEYRVPNASQYPGYGSMDTAFSRDWIAPVVSACSNSNTALMFQKLASRLSVCRILSVCDMALAGWPLSR